MKAGLRSELALINFGKGGPGLFLGGNLGISTSSSEVTFGTTTTDGPKGMRFMISPTIGYYFTENVAAGIRIGYGSAKQTSIVGNNDLEDSEASFDVQLFGRYATTFGSDGSFAWFVEANAGYASITSVLVIRFSMNKLSFINTTS